jgi:hypothetical protein
VATGNWIGATFAGVAVMPGATYNVDSSEFYNSSGVTQGTLGTKSTGQGNLIVGGSYGVYTGATYTTMAVYGNTVCGASVAAMWYCAHYNQDEAPPVVDTASPALVQGHAGAGEYIEVFRAEHGLGFAGGSLRFIGSATADSSGQWSVPGGGLLSAGEFVCATCTNPLGNLTSVFSNNVQVLNTGLTPVFTRTSTPSPTITPTPGAGAGATATPTPVASSTQIPAVAALVARAFPNPGRDKVRFTVDLDRGAVVKVVVFNLAGRKITEIKETRTSGRAQVLTWDCSQAATGIYLAKVFVDNQETVILKVAVAR